MRQFLIIFGLLGVFNLNGQNDKSVSNYLNFVNDSKNVNAYKIGDRIELQDILYSLVKVDTTVLLPLNLIDTTSKSKFYGIPDLNGYNCGLLGIFKNQMYDCIITCSLTTTAGDGNQIIHLSTYSKDGKQISCLIYPISYQHDYTPIPQQYFTFKNNIITFELIEKNYDYIDSLGRGVLRYKNTTLNNQSYSIDLDGRINKRN
jgi:hypothetical protein